MSSQGDIVQKEPKMKRAKQGEREGKVDYISTMPSGVLIYILAMLTTKEAVQTCILSKRWSNVWKYLPTLVASITHFQNAELFERFVSKFLEHRDGGSNLTNVDFEHHRNDRPWFLGELIKYAVEHEVEHLKISSYVNKEAPVPVLFRGTKFSCNKQNLKYLNLSFRQTTRAALVPHILENFPELIECHLRCVTFWAKEKNGCVNPFSGCKKMTTLSIDCCALDIAKCLVVVSDTLTNMSIRYKLTDECPFKVRMSTPNLTSFAYVGRITPCNTRLLFEHNLNFLEEVRMEVCCRSFTSGVARTLQSWLRRYTNVHSMTISSAALKILSAIPGFPNERLNLGKLVSLTIKLDYKLPHPLGDEVLNYLLQDSPSAAVTISPDIPSYYDDMEFVYKHSLSDKLKLQRRNSMRKNQLL